MPSDLGEWIWFCWWWIQNRTHQVWPGDAPPRGLVPGWEPTLQLLSLLHVRQHHRPQPVQKVNTECLNFFEYSEGETAFEYSEG